MNSVRWIKMVDLRGEIERIVKNTILNKEKVKEILEKHRHGAARFKNDVGLLGQEYAYEIKGGIPRPQRQYTINKKALPEIGETIKELEQLGVIKVIDNAVTNSPVQAVEKNDFSWRLVSNFKALNKVSVPDNRYLINARDVTNGLPKGSILSQRLIWQMVSGLFHLLRRAWQRLPSRSKPDIFVTQGSHKDS